MLAGFAQLERVMKQKQDDELYNKMLDELDKGKQHHGGKIEYQGYQQQQTQADVHLLRKAQLEAAMRRNTGGSNSSFDPGEAPTVQNGFYRTKTGWHPVKGNGAAANTNQRQQLADQFGVKSNELSPAIGAIDAYTPGKTEFPKVGIYQQGNDTPGDRKQALVDAVRAYHSGAQGGAPNAGAPDAQALAAQAVYDNPAKDYSHSIPGANEAPAAKAGPRPGETRNVGGKQYQWDGQGWLPL